MTGYIYGRIEIKVRGLEPSVFSQGSKPTRLRVGSRRTKPLVPWVFPSGHSENVTRKEYERRMREWK